MIVSGALALAACSSSPDWLTPGPTMDNVRFESEPPNAEVKVSNGQACRTPCALALPAEVPLTVTFTLSGYQPESETLEVIADGGFPRLRPNPVTVELTPAPPPPAAKRPAKKTAPAKRPPAAAAPAPARAAAPAAAPAPMAPVQQQPAPWPAPPAQR